VKSPTRGGLVPLIRFGAWFRFETRFRFDAGASRFDFVELLCEIFAARLGASGVTDAGALGSPLVGVLFAGPGRFKSVLESLQESRNHSVDVATAHSHDEVTLAR
jgi:hypothetical protein